MTTELENTEYEEEIYEDFEFIIEESDDENLKMLTIYSENIENDKYYIGSEVCELLGHKNITHFIKKNVRDDNKIKFKNYTGKKEPVLDSRQILLKKEGVYELLKKNRKKLSEDTIDILIKANIDVSKIIKDIKDTKDDDDSDDSDEEDEDELTMYSYINNGYCFEYFIGLQITSLIGYSNVTQALSNVSKQNKLEFRDYPGVKKPKLDPKSILITRDGAIELLIKTRKRISSDVLYMLKEFGIDTTNRKCLTKEQQTLSAIANAFKTEKIEDQFKIGNYYLDMLFPEYRIVVECDENGHADRKPYKERERMDYVNKEFDIDDSYWIRYNPDEYDFDISRVIGRIYNKINEIKDRDVLVKVEPKKVDIISEIVKVFDESEIMEIDYDIKNQYKIDLYFPEYKIIVDCIENEYSDLANEERILIINKWLKIDDTYWIRYDKEMEDISKIIGEVFLLMKTKKKSLYRVCSTCKKSKELDDFHLSSYQTLGRDYSCKVCKNMKNKIKNDKKKENLVEISEKICETCKETKEIEHFWKGICYRDGYCKNCKICETEYRKKILEEKRKLPENFKECSKCKEIKAKQEFNKRSDCYDGFQTICRVCVNSLREEKKEKEYHDPNILKVLYDDDGNRYFVASEVAKMIGYDRSDALIRYIPKDDKIVYKNIPNIKGPKAKPNVVLITLDDIKNYMKTTGNGNVYALRRLKRIIEDDDIHNIPIEEK